MIQTNNPEIDAMIKELTGQRNSALDAVAVLSGKLYAAEVRAASTEARLKELEKRKKKSPPPPSEEPKPGVAS